VCFAKIWGQKSRCIGGQNDTFTTRHGFGRRKRNEKGDILPTEKGKSRKKHTGKRCWSSVGGISGVTSWSKEKTEGKGGNLGVGERAGKANKNPGAKGQGKQKTRTSSNDVIALKTTTHPDASSHSRGSGPQKFSTL